MFRTIHARIILHAPCCSSPHMQLRHAKHLFRTPFKCSVSCLVLQWAVFKCACAGVVDARKGVISHGRSGALSPNIIPSIRFVWISLYKGLNLTICASWTDPGHIMTQFVMMRYCLQSRMLLVACIVMVCSILSTGNPDFRGWRDDTVEQWLHCHLTARRPLA